MAKISLPSSVFHGSGAVQPAKLSNIQPKKSRTPHRFHLDERHARAG
jgi:hypothetical protein